MSFSGADFIKAPPTQGGFAASPVPVIKYFAPASIVLKKLADL